MQPGVSGVVDIPLINNCTCKLQITQGGQKRKPLPNDQKIVLNRIKTCE